MVATAKAKKESKEVYRRVVLIIVTKSSFERAPYSRSRMGGGGGGGGDLYHSQRISSVEVD